MADAQATFVATLDTSGIQSGARSALTGLQRMGAEIQKRSKDLAAMKAAQARLTQSAGVQEFMKRQKAIERNEAFQAKVEKRLADAVAKRDAAQAAGAPAETIAKLAGEADKAKVRLGEATKELADLQAKQDALAKGDAGVAAFRDNAKVIKESEAGLADLQARYSAAGGSATDLADKIEEPKQGLEGLVAKATEAGVPLGKLGTLLGKIGPKAGPLALLAVVIAIGAAAVTAAARLAKMAIVSADIARNAARARASAAFGSVAGTKEIEGAMAALRENTAASKAEAQALARELYRLGDRGDRLTETALTIERFGQLGEDAKGAVKGLYEELRKPIPAIGGAVGVAKSMQISKDSLPRDLFLELATQLGQDGQRALQHGFLRADKGQIRTALARIGEQRFAGPALDQMRSLDKLAERLRENLRSLFEKLKVGVLLGALQKLVAILDEGSASGKAIREVLAAFAQPFADAVEAALPYVTAFVKGLIFGGLVVALVAIKIKNALSGLIPDSLTKNIDWMKVAFVGAAAIVITLALALGLLATAAFLVALPFLTVAAIVLLLVAALVMAADAIVGWLDEVSEAFEGQDFSEIAGNIIDGLIGGLKDGAAKLYKAFTDLAKGGYQAFKDAIMSKSPSKLFRLAGHTIPQGVALGVEDETPEVKGALASMASPADMATPSGGNAGTRGASSSGLTIVLQPGAVVIRGERGAEDLEDEGFLRKLGRALVSVAREGGVSPEPEPA